MGGRRNPLLGKAGEGLFQCLAAYHWDAEVERHDTRAIDFVISWGDFPEAGKVFVQIKSVDRLGDRRARHLEAAKVAGWATLRPIVVICELSQMRAWWIDTEPMRLPARSLHSFRLPFEFDNPLQRGTKAAVQKLAYRKNNRLMLATPQRLPRRLKTLRPKDIPALMREIEQEISGASVLRKDVVGLGGARVIYQVAPSLSFQERQAMLPGLLNQARSVDPGGRSHCLGAAAGLLLAPGDSWPKSRELERELQQTADAALEAWGYAHPELALVASARGAEIGSGDSEHFRDLLRRAMKVVRNPWFSEFAEKMTGWHPVARPVSTLFDGQFLRKSIFRPSDSALGIIGRQDEAEGLVKKMLADGFDDITDDDLILVDELTRFRADQFLWHEFGWSPSAAYQA